jgi:hypothetical protein
MRAIAINVGANTNDPGFRAPVYPDGRFEFLPIPETEPVTDAPTYGDLAPHVGVTIPGELRETPVHLDPEFPEYPCGEQYTYGDEHGVKAGPLAELSAGDCVFFYATLSVTRESAAGDPAPDRDTSRAPEWLPSGWGAFLVGRFRLARDPVTGEEYRDLSAAQREPFATNAHVRRDPVDARVFLLGDPEGSRLYDRCVPLSRPAGGTEPNALVTGLSEDSGRGPWWRRPLRFGDRSSRLLLAFDEAFRHGLAAGGSRRP